MATPNQPPKKAPIRLTKQAGRLPSVVAVGQKRHFHEDLYHWILTLSWPRFFVFVGAVFFGLNTLFATAYLLVPGAISNLPPGDFEDAFYFSVQTLATIGYGVMSPATRAGHMLVAFEALTGLMSMALMTGITFSKFARPTARVLFADKITLTPRDGVPHLMFRMANWRGNQMVDAELKVTLLVTETTREGEVMRTPINIPLVRQKTMLFILTWLPMHKIDETSPFHGDDAIEKLRATKADIFLSLTGYDETIGQTVHARYSYKLDDIVRNVRFADVLSQAEDGTRQLNYHHFHDVVPINTVVEPPLKATAPVPVDVRIETAAIAVLATASEGASEGAGADLPN